MRLRMIIKRIPLAKPTYRGLRHIGRKIDKWMQLTSKVKSMPLTKPIYEFFHDTRRADVFEQAFCANVWGGRESRSGPGSDLQQARVIMAELPKLISEFGFTTLLDIPCGDFHWMQHVDLGQVHYIGGDIVSALIAMNQERYGSEIREFRLLDVTEDKLPRVDLILCRDCLVHLSYRLVRKALANIKRSGSHYLLTTTFPGLEKNSEVSTGGWRPLNLSAPPFDFPLPLRLINEQCPEERYRDKSLGLWTLDSIPYF